MGLTTQQTGLVDENNQPLLTSFRNADLVADVAHENAMMEQELTLRPFSSANALGTIAPTSNGEKIA